MHIVAGVVDQIIEGDDICNVPIEPCEKDPEQGLCKYADQVDLFRMEAPYRLAQSLRGTLGIASIVANITARSQMPM